MPNNNAILFQPTGEVRRAKPGEWFEDSYAGFFECRLTGSTTYSHPIFTRHEIPAELGKKMMEGEE